MRLKLDENLDVRLAIWLKSLGHDAETVRSEALSGAPDQALFSVVHQENRCLVTLDLDFADPVRFPPTGSPGIIVLRAPVPSMSMIRRLLEQALLRARSESPADQIWIVEPGRIRSWSSPERG
jgi:predicted nuclease of predicted toxin-antitoxin system